MTKHPFHDLQRAREALRRRAAGMNAEEARCALAAAVAALAQQSEKQQMTQTQLVKTESQLQDAQQLLATAKATVQVSSCYGTMTLAHEHQHMFRTMG